MLLGSIKAFIHAFIPDLCVTSTSDINEKITTILKNNGCHKTKQNNDSTIDKED
tara:strand:+ start:785 stop:946 length:162 start_codon:yes stop_codon:yes gene_type:complete